MRPRRSFAAALAIGIGALALGCGSSSPVATGASTTAPTTQERIDDATGTTGEVSSKKVFKPDHPDIAVLVGEKFAIRVPEDPATGQSWKVISAPDERVVKGDGDSFKAEAPAAGAAAPSAGQHEFKFKARAAGTTTITVSRPGSEEPRSATFTITVS